MNQVGTPTIDDSRSFDHFLRSSSHSLPPHNSVCVCVGVHLVYAGAIEVTTMD